MESVGSVRLGNIDQQGQNTRIRMSITLLALTLGAALLLIGGGFPMWMRGLVFFPLFIVAFLSLQGLHQVCFFAATQGVQVRDGCMCKVTDSSEQSRLMRDARMVLLESLGGAGLGTALLFLLP